MNKYPFTYSVCNFIMSLPTYCSCMLGRLLIGSMPAYIGESLDSIKTTVQALSENMGTMGLALGPCSLPGN